ncbi:MAG: hypothetical protein E7259_08070 [Lachnospiraceae bacterium]|nr:hypothetical protein [Lachnospiraceae bacterium]
MIKSIGVFVVLLLLCNPLEIKATDHDNVAFVKEYDKKENTINDVARDVPHYNINTHGGTWDGTYYYLPDGQLATECFFCDGTYTYYLQNDGTPMKNRLTYHPDGEHIIYFDEEGHEAFDSMEHIEVSISGEAVDDYCYFGTYGYMYVDEFAFTGHMPRYFNAYGVLEDNGWFMSGDGNYGYATEDGYLIKEKFGYNPYGQIVFYHWNGMVAKGIIEDDNFYYYMNENDGHLEGVQKKVDTPDDTIPLTYPGYVDSYDYDMCVLGDNFLTQSVKDNNFIKYMKEKYSPYQDWVMWIYPDENGSVINTENNKAELFITNRGIMVGSTKEDVYYAYDATKAYDGSSIIREYSIVDGKLTSGNIVEQYNNIEILYPGVAEILKKAESYVDVWCSMFPTDKYYPQAPYTLYDNDGIRFFFDSNGTVIMIEYYRQCWGNQMTFE